MLNLNITVSTTLKYCFKKALNKKLKLMAGAISLNGYFEEINGNKYLTLVPTNANKQTKEIRRTME